jgi:uncharacterized protein YkwD
VKKLFIVVFVFIILGYVAVFATKNFDTKKLLKDIGSQKVYFQRDSNASFMPDWKADELLNQINTAREIAGLSRLTGNERLDQSAKARLSVILSENDVDGSVTGLTREQALENADYQASLVGDLILLGYYKTNDPVNYWNNTETSKGTLYHPDFKDVGIAVKNTNERVDIYVLLVAPKRIVKQVTAPRIAWGGPELWEAVNKRRVEMGVNPLKNLSELCTIASIRLNQLLELNKLDGHAGFVPVLERDDLKWISKKYNISEYLIQGYKTPTEAVNAWENTMGHRSLLSGGEYVWGCIYAQNTFGVAITAY